MFKHMTSRWCPCRVSDGEEISPHPDWCVDDMEEGSASKKKKPRSKVVEDPVVAAFNARVAETEREIAKDGMYSTDER